MTNESPKPPWTVALACAVSLAVCIWDITAAVSDEEVFESRSFLAILLALNTIPLVFTFAAFFRRNWGRIVLTVITALGALTLPFVMLSGEQAGDVPVDVEAVLYSLAEVTVIVLLFAPRSNSWYRRPRVQPA